MKTALILVDIQNDYFPGGKMELNGIGAAGGNAADLLSFFRNNNWLTFHIRHIAAGEGATFFLPGTAGAELHDLISPLPGEPVIEKHFANSFRETELLGKLEEARITKLVICGAMSHMCIDATTRAAADLGFECVVAQDACATRELDFGGVTIPSEHVHGAFMAALGAAYARVLDCEEIMGGVIP
jgi:nicotinamidase-related amidase